MAAAVTPVIVFVNPRSGGQAGKKLLSVRQPLELDLEDGRRVAVLIFNVLDAESRTRGCSELSRASSQHVVPVIIAGGDGSIMATVEWLIKPEFGISVSTRIQLGVIALGTGNDFSRALGWGGAAPKRMMRHAARGDFRLLKKLACEWLDAVAMPFDVWKVALRVDDHDGEIIQGANTLDSHVVVKNMINYFSIGQDAWTGLEVEKNRTSSRYGNFLCYCCCSAIMTMPCHVKDSVSRVLRAVHNGTHTGAPAVFDTEDPESPQLATDLFGGHAESIVALNIHSYSGGLAKHLWEGATRQGVDRPLQSDLMRKSCDPGDGHLDVVSVRNLFTLSQDWLSPYLRHWGGRRIFSGAPLFYRFNDGVTAHCNVDGEYFELRSAESATVEPALAPDGKPLKLLVLHRDAEEDEDEDEGESTDSDSSDCSED